MARLFILQIVQHRDYVALASRQHSGISEIAPKRGLIYAQDKNRVLIPLALNKLEKNLVASPKNVKNPEEAADFLSENFGLDREEILQKLSQKSDSYEVLAKGFEPEELDKFRGMMPTGVFSEDEKKRVYPQGAVASQLLGFVSKEAERDEGRYGLERFYEKELSGAVGLFQGIKDASGFWTALGKKIIHPSRNGSAVITTIDYNIQLKAEEVLSSTRNKWQAETGAILALDPRSGKILAMAANPTFNPNEFYKEKDFSVFLNPLVSSMYELGSVLKPVTMAGGLEEGLVKPDSTYEDPGLIKIGNYAITNFDQKAHGLQTMTQVLEKSLNTGAVYVSRLLGHERQKDYLERFGFGKLTGVDLPSDLPGNISNLKSGREIDFATASFGQGIAVTPLQLASAIGAIANQGQLMKPYAVEKIVDDSGNEILKEPAVARQVIASSTAETLTKMLVSAVRNGFENRAGVKGYFVAGKTGTAQIPLKQSRGYSTDVIHTFVGYAPAFSPRFLILIQLNKPQGNRFASNTLTPAFHDLAEFILNYYEVPPDEK